MINVGNKSLLINYDINISIIIFYERSTFFLKYILHALNINQTDIVYVITKDFIEQIK